MAPRFSRLAAGAVLALGALSFAGRASAQSCDSPEHARGNSLRQSGRDREAYEVFRGIFEREHTGCAQARMGLALSALGRWADADAALRGALARGDAWINQNRATLENRLQALQSHLGQIDVQIEPAVPGAELYIDGQRVGTLPLSQPLRVGTGDVIVEVRAPGYEPRRRNMMVSAGQVARESITMVATATTPGNTGGAPPVLEPNPNPNNPPVLQPPPNGGPPPGGPEGPGPGMQGGPGVPPPNAYVPPPSGGSSISPVGPIIGGIGALVAGSSLITWLMANDTYSRIQARGCTSASPCLDAASQSDASSVRTLDAVTNVLLFGGIGIAVVGAILTPVLRTSSEAPRQAYIRPGFTGTSLVLEGRF